MVYEDNNLHVLKFFNQELLHLFRNKDGSGTSEDKFIGEAMQNVERVTKGLAFLNRLLAGQEQSGGSVLTTEEYTELCKAVTALKRIANQQTEFATGLIINQIKQGNAHRRRFEDCMDMWADYGFDFNSNPLSYMKR